VEISENYLKLEIQDTSEFYILRNYKKYLPTKKLRNLKIGNLLPICIREFDKIRLDLSKKAYKVILNYNQWIKFFQFCRNQNLQIPKNKQKELRELYDNVPTLLDGSDFQDKFKEIIISYKNFNSTPQNIRFQLELFQPNFKTVINQIDKLSNTYNYKIHKESGNLYTLETYNPKSCLNILQNTLQKYKHTFKICKSI
jgi:hypothetical protein